MQQRVSQAPRVAGVMDPTAVNEQLDRILRSETFASKEQLKRLLEILSKSMDSQPPLKPAQVIQELWPAETRTKRAADVATEINRLRHALYSYYEEEGDNDQIIISLPNRSPTVTNGKHEKRDRKSTRLNSSHMSISYAVFCLKKKKKKQTKTINTINTIIK